PLRARLLVRDRATRHHVPSTSATRGSAAAALFAAAPALAQSDECDCRPNTMRVPCPPARKPKAHAGASEAAEEEEPAATPAAVPARAATATRSRRGALLFAVKAGLFQPTSRLGGALYVGAEFAYVPPILRQAVAAVLEVDWVRPETSGSPGDPRLVTGGGYTLPDQQ